MLLLNINKKPHMGSPMTLSHLTLSGLERSKSTPFRFRSFVPRKGADLDHTLLLNINRKACMGESIGAITFRRLISRKGPQLGPVLLLDTNRKPHMESPAVPPHLTIVSRSLRL